jgi:N-acetyl-anhydromuramyl-L-alanine amidase AmpD
MKDTRYERGVKYAMENGTQMSNGVWWVPAAPGNYTVGNRDKGQINAVVIHTAEGWSAGAKTFRKGGRKASAHYGVERNGLITQMVADKDIAWHAGSGLNTQSIGIEHAGYAKASRNQQRGERGWPRVQLRASAKLVARLARQYRIPVNRRYIVGHNQAGACKGTPSAMPGRPTLGPVLNSRGQRGGGKGCHYDPGVDFPWGRFMMLVKWYRYRPWILGLGGLTIAALVVTARRRGQRRIAGWESIAAGRD